MKNPIKHVVIVFSFFFKKKKDFKNTTKLTWLAVAKAAPLLPALVVHFGNIISKPILTKNDDFKDHVNNDTKVSNHSSFFAPS